MLQVRVTPVGGDGKRIYGVILYDINNPFQLCDKKSIVKKFGYLNKQEYETLIKQFTSIAKHLTFHGGG